MRTASLELQLAAQLHAIQTPAATRWCSAVRGRLLSAHDGGWVPPLLRAVPGKSRAVLSTAPAVFVKQQLLLEYASRSASSASREQAGMQLVGIHSFVPSTIGNAHMSGLGPGSALRSEDWLLITSCCSASNLPTRFLSSQQCMKLTRDLSGPPRRVVHSSSVPRLG